MSQVHKARAQAAKARTRLNAIIFTVGAPMIVASMALAFIQYFQGLQWEMPATDNVSAAEMQYFWRDAPTYAFMYLIPVPPFVSFVLLAVLPTDGPLIHAIRQQCTVLMIICTLIMTTMFLLVVFGSPSGRYLGYRGVSCTPGAPIVTEWCYALASIYASWAITFGATAGIFLATGKREPGTPAPTSKAYQRIVLAEMDDFRKEHGVHKFLLLFVFGFPGPFPAYWIERRSIAQGLCFYSPSRWFLGTMWTTTRIFGFIMGGMMILTSGAAAVYLPVPLGRTDSAERFLSDPDVISFFLFGASSIIFMGILPTVRNRRYMRGWLVRVAQNSEEREAMTLSRLIGGISTATAADIATRSFRSVTFDNLSADRAFPKTLDPIHVTDVESTHREPKASSASITMPTLLGSCDAFVSHSHCENHSHKWAALAQWCEEFQAVRNRSPRLWLDTLCLDEKQADQSLKVLPLYLAGCQQLLILFGPEFPKRLWCAVELFTYLKMGATHDRVVVLPLGTWTMDDVSVHINPFDVRLARCSKGNDRQHLLAIIEAGFGDYEAFNQLVRSILQESVFTRAPRVPSALHDPQARVQEA